MIEGGVTSMATGWQREFAAANRETWWKEKCLREDLQAGKLDGKTPFVIACEYDLSERKVKRILREVRDPNGVAMTKEEADVLAAKIQAQFPFHTVIVVPSTNMHNWCISMKANTEYTLLIHSEFEWHAVLERERLAGR